MFIIASVFLYNLIVCAHDVNDPKLVSMNILILKGSTLGSIGQTNIIDQKSFAYYIIFDRGIWQIILFHIIQ